MFISRFKIRKCWLFCNWQKQDVFWDNFISAKCLNPLSMTFIIGDCLHKQLRLRYSVWCGVDFSEIINVWVGNLWFLSLFYHNRGTRTAWNSIFPWTVFIFAENAWTDSSKCLVFVLIWFALTINFVISFFNLTRALCFCCCHYLSFNHSLQIKVSADQRQSFKLTHSCLVRISFFYAGLIGRGVLKLV